MKNISHSNKLIGSLCSLTVSFTFCLHFFVAKDVLQTVSPILLGGVRGFFGGILLFVMYYKDVRSIAMENIQTLLAIAFFGYVANQILFLNGLMLSTPLNTAVIMNLIPITAALIAILFGVEKFSWRKIIGCIIGFTMVVILSSSKSNGDVGIGLGDILIFGSVIFLCFSTMLTKRLVKDGFPSPIISASMLFFGGFALLMWEVDKFYVIVDYSLESNMNLGKIIFEIVISTSFTYLLSFKALKYLSPSQSMIFIYLQPLMAAGIDFLVYSKQPPMILIPVFIGVSIAGYLVVTSKN